MRKLVLDSGLPCILLLFQYSGGQSLPILEIDPKNVQDLLENVDLTFTCTFGFSANRLGSAVSVKHGAEMAVETYLVGKVPNVVNGLNNARTTYNSTLNQVAVSVTTTRTLNNLTFSCINSYFNRTSGVREVIKSSQPIVVKCKIYLRLYGYVFVVMCLCISFRWSFKKCIWQH